MSLRTTLSLIFTMLLSIAAWSQQPSSTYDFRAVVQPGMTIGGHLFTSDTVIDSVALSDAGEPAFIAHWSDASGAVHGAVFTPRRVVAIEGDSRDGRTIVAIPMRGRISINNVGQVAFDAVYRERLGVGSNGVFIEKQLAYKPSIADLADAFSLTDDGRIVPEFLKSSAAPAPPASGNAQKKPSLLDQVHVKPPKLPFGISIGPKSPAPSQTRPAPPAITSRPPLPEVTSPFEIMSTNQRGQILIPVNLSPNGFILLLGTPSAEANGR